VTDFNLASEMTPGATAVTISDTKDRGDGGPMPWRRAGSQEIPMMQGPSWVNLVILTMRK
jgi:hypothetical protein